MLIVGHPSLFASLTVGESKCDGKACRVTSTKTDMLTINSKTKEPTMTANFSRLKLVRNRMKTGIRRTPKATADATSLANIPRREVE